MKFNLPIAKIYSVIEVLISLATLVIVLNFLYRLNVGAKIEITKVEHCDKK